MDTTASSETQGQSGGEEAGSDPLKLRVSEDKMAVYISSSLPPERYGEIEATLAPELKRIGVPETSAQNRGFCCPSRYEEIRRSRSLSNAPHQHSV